VQLALLTGAPILPVAHWGGQDFWRNIKRFRRTSIRYRVGQPFYLKHSGAALPRAERDALTGEVMRRIAQLLPEELRGEYAECAESASRIEFV